MTEVDLLEIECPECGEIEKLNGKLLKPGYKRWITCSSCQKKFRYERPKDSDIISRASDMYEEESVKQERLPPLEMETISPVIDAEEERPDGRTERQEIQKGPSDEPKIVHLACPSCGSRILKIIGTGPEVFREKRYSGISAVRTLFQASQESAIQAFTCGDCGHSWWMISGEFDDIEEEGSVPDRLKADAGGGKSGHPDRSAGSTSTEPPKIIVPKIAGKAEKDTNGDCCFTAFIIALVGFGVILFFIFLASFM